MNSTLLSLNECKVYGCTSSRSVGSILMGPVDPMGYNDHISTRPPRQAGPVLDGLFQPATLDDLFQPAPSSNGPVLDGLFQPALSSNGPISQPRPQTAPSSMASSSRPLSTASFSRPHPQTAPSSIASSNQLSSTASFSRPHPQTAPSLMASSSRPSSTASFSLKRPRPRWVEAFSNSGQSSQAPWSPNGSQLPMTQACPHHFWPNSIHGPGSRLSSRTPFRTCLLSPVPWRLPAPMPPATAPSRLLPATPDSFGSS